MLQAILDRAVAEGVYSVIVGLVADGDALLWSGAAGTLSGEAVGAAPDLHTRFDLASITKSFTGSLAILLDQSSELPLGARVGDVLPSAADALAAVRLEALLRQRAGFQPWTPLYARCLDRDEALALLLDGSLLGAAPNSYSDLGFILWGFAAEAACGEPLARLLSERVAAPLALGGIAPQPGAGRDVAHCLADGAREAELAADGGWSVMTPPAPEPGQAQDGNARFLGALCGHAGLFGSADAVWRYAREWLAPGAVLDPTSVGGALAGEGPFLLGWSRPGAWQSLDGVLGERCFGALGFAGGSLWIDPKAARIALLLGHRSSALSDLGPLRRAFHAAARDSG